MKPSVLLGSLTRPAASAKVLTLAALLVLCVEPSYAGQTNSQFQVLINLQSHSGTPNAGICRSSSRIGTFGEVVTVECTTGKVVTFSGNANGLPWTAMQDGSYRFLTQLSEEPVSLGTLDVYAGGGTVTSWRIVRLANRDYIELMVGW
ncbi:MAG: hypothetical protein HOO95_08065 [Gallionella sp.]|nr:hypothetical protein [Gallionella sp.]